ncbi:MAG TPA: hypothetical protein DCE83_00365 [Enterococcus sp.]|nr:hypothetical protein CO692_07085 [Enterococcus sp. FDAARGOS_375]MBZ0324020.1 ABC transporter ATP-binding protein [Enterococcus casseliflavus]HAB95285.1 hypothetical protein [Enterococcus sp.]
MHVYFFVLLSGGEQRLVALAYHLFTNQDFYGFEDGKRYNNSLLEVFSGVDEAGYQLIKKVIYRRLQFYSLVLIIVFRNT